MAKAVLIDGHSLIHRAWHALPALNTSSGELVNAVYGFTSTLLKVLSEERPDYVVVAFDVGRTFRHDRFEPYKATRDKTPDELHAQFARVEQVLDALEIPVIGVEGYEADDVLATLADRGREEGLDVLVVSGDTDSFQLVRPGVRVLTQRGRFADTVIYDVEGIRQRYDIPPQQLVDHKALVGDTSDNIPGVPGIGTKTASKLLQEHGSLEGIFERLEAIGGKTAQALREHRDSVFLARELVRLVHDVPMEFEWQQARSGRFERDRVVDLFRELEFKTLLERLPEVTKALGADGATPTAQEVLEALDYRTVAGPEELEELLAILGRVERLAYDVETTGTHPFTAELVGLAFAWAPGRGAYVPFGHAPQGLFDERDAQQLDRDQALARLRPLLEDPERPKLAHHGKYDATVLRRYGVEVRGLVFDTLLASHLVDPSTMSSNSLKDLAFNRLGKEMTQIEELIGRGRGQVTMAEVEVRQAAPYAAADADVTLQLVPSLEADLEARGLVDLFRELELPLVDVLIEMEMRGVKVDVSYLKGLSREFYQRIKALEEDIHGLAGHPFNINSTQQLGTVLFDELRLPAARRTKTGYSTSADVLESLREAHPIVEQILAYRELAKLKSTYIDALPLLVNEETGRVHPIFKQTGAVTGRLACEAPNIQNIPLRTEEGRRVRRAFVAEEGNVLLAADYSQVELRVLAHISGDENLIAAFERDEDIHAATAATVHGIPLAEVTPDMRRLAKVVNFGLVYGLSDWGLAAQTELSQAEAAEFIRQYFAGYPRVQEYIGGVKQEARERGYVATVLGRRRYFPELQLGSGSRVHLAARRAAERMAINHPIQGSAADIIKLAMLDLQGAFGERGWQRLMIMQVHDELVFELPRAMLREVAAVVREKMEGAYELRVRLKVDLSWGSNWEEMEPLGP